MSAALGAAPLRGLRLQAPDGSAATGARGRRLGAGRPRRAGADAGDQILDRHQLPQVDPPQQRHLEVIARLRGAADVGLRPRQQVERAQQILAREARGQRLQPIALAFAGDLRIG